MIDGFSDTDLLEAGEEVAIVLDPFPKQLEFINACYDPENFFILYGGAIRGGKSMGLMALIQEIKDEFSDARYVIMREDRPQITKNLMPKLFEAFDKSEFSQLPNDKNGYIAKFKSGMELIFWGENYDSKLKYLEDFKGLEVDGVLIDEISGIHEETYEKCFERIGTWKMRERQQDINNGKSIPPRIIAATCNPTQGYIKRKIYDRWKKETLPKGMKYIPSSVYDNPYVSEDWIENKRATMTPHKFQMMVNGDWEVNDNLNPFFFYVREESLRGDLQIWEDEALIFSFDFNIDSCAATVSQMKKTYGQRILGGHLVYGGIRELCKALKLESFGYFPHTDRILVTGDPSGKSGNAAAGINKSGQKINSFKIIQEEFDIMPHQIIGFPRILLNHELSRDLCNDIFYKIPVEFDEEFAIELWHEIMKAKPRTNEKGDFVELYKNRSNGFEMDLVDSFRYNQAFTFKSTDNVNKMRDIIRDNQPKIYEDFTQFEYALKPYRQAA